MVWIWVPPASSATFSWAPAPMATVDERASPVTAAPADDWVTVTVWSPAARVPAVTDSEATPRDPARESRTPDPAGRIEALVEATPARVTTEFADASRSTVKVSEPGSAVPVAEAVTELDEVVAFMDCQEATVLRPAPASRTAAIRVLSVW